jgi:N-methylhydantoinase B
VAHDVRQGYVSPGVARDVYGVALDPKTLAVDPAATEKQRAELKRRKP